MLENGAYWFIVIDEVEDALMLIFWSSGINGLMVLDVLFLIGISFLYQVILNGWSPWLLEHIICVLIPSVISSSKANGDIRGGTE